MRPAAPGSPAAPPFPPAAAGSGSTAPGASWLRAPGDPVDAVIALLESAVAAAAPGAVGAAAEAAPESAFTTGVVDAEGVAGTRLSVPTPLSVGRDRASGARHPRRSARGDDGDLLEAHLRAVGRANSVGARAGAHADPVDREQLEQDPLRAFRKDTVGRARDGRRQLAAAM